MQAVQSAWARMAASSLAATSSWMAARPLPIVPANWLRNEGAPRRHQGPNPRRERTAGAQHDPCVPARHRCEVDALLATLEPPDESRPESRYDDRRRRARPADPGGGDEGSGRGLREPFRGDEASG